MKSVIVSMMAFLLALAGASQQPTEKKQGQVASGDMAEMMKRAAKYTRPGEEHKQLEKFLGKWNSSMQITMAGQATPAEKGTAEGAWIMEGRWLKFETTGALMGQPYRNFMLIGYDRFKMSFVTTAVSSLDTAMVHSEGDMDPGGKALITYGTLDEYLTGEHDKMVRYVWRFVSDDQIVVEVHDLPIGEKNTKVIEIQLTRAP